MSKNSLEHFVSRTLVGSCVYTNSLKNEQCLKNNIKTRLTSSCRNVSNLLLKKQVGPKQHYRATTTCRISLGNQLKSKILNQNMTVMKTDFYSLDEV